MSGYYMQKNRALILILLILIGTTHTGRNGKHNWTQAQQRNKYVTRTTTLEEKKRFEAERIAAHKEKLARNKKKREEKQLTLQAVTHEAKPKKLEAAKTDTFINLKAAKKTPINWEELCSDSE
jgi:hypothetical protein